MYVLLQYSVCLGVNHCNAPLRCIKAYKYANARYTAVWRFSCITYLLFDKSLAGNRVRNGDDSKPDLSQGYWAFSKPERPFCPPSMMLPPPCFTSDAVGHMGSGFLQTWCSELRLNVQPWFHQTKDSQPEEDQLLFVHTDWWGAVVTVNLFGSFSHVFILGDHLVVNPGSYQDHFLQRVWFG